uniref:Uncharacterized protein n=1 Tax=Acrobeloides nanus TaxID=290746 RepID=A0A914ER16_9BILA
MIHLPTRVTYARQASTFSTKSARSPSVSTPRNPFIRMISIDQEVSIKKKEKESQEDEKSEKERLREELEKEGGKRQGFRKILLYARPEWKYLILALIASALSGFVFLAFSLFFTQIIEVFSITDTNKLKHEGHFWALMFVAIGIFQGTTMFLSIFFFALTSERMTKRLRSNLFKNIMRMDIAYFDMPQHSSGKISTRLATDTPNVKTAIDNGLGGVVQAVVSLILGITFSFYYGWQMAIVMLAIFPLAGLGQWLEVKYFENRHEKDKKENENAGHLALEAIENIRTVQSLTFGLYLIENGSLEPMNVMKVLFAMSFTTGSIGWAASYFPEYTKARLAAGIIFKMLREKSKIDSLMDDGQRPFINGTIELKDVQFAYYERPESIILKGLDLTIKQGQTLAIVGPSGCGKSTVISLLERFYDPFGGKILIDGNNLREMNVSHVRSQIALVSQEPILFDCSIKENITYGYGPTFFTMNQIKQACKIANIDKFIENNLSEGYETRVGEKGVQLSGGQKQRIAIARALIRNPKILLLDEATSALDAESEKIVQEALDRASQSRTCIIIAHRLSTIVNADCIVVMKNGVVIEQGTHTELINKRGAYYELTKTQNMASH